MYTLLMLVILSAAGLAAAGEHPRLDDREAPRATDLLRAETLSHQAERRLRRAPAGGGGWVRGGSGWGTSPPPPPER